MLESLKDAIDRAMTDPTSDSIDWIHTGAEIVDGVEVVIAIVTASGTTGSIASLAQIIEGVGGSVAWPVTVGAAAIAGEFAVLGLPYAEAAKKIKEDRSATGFCKGVVMGAMKEKSEFLKWNFFEWDAEPNDFWPEAGMFAQHYYNAALALGYHYGYELDNDETTLFFKDLSRGLTEPLGDPDTAGTDEERERAWVNFYIAAGVQFHKLHIQGEDE